MILILLGIVLAAICAWAVGLIYGDLDDAFNAAFVTAMALIVGLLLVLAMYLILSGLLEVVSR